MSKGDESRMQRFVLYNSPPGSSRARHLNVSSKNKSRWNLQTAVSVLLIAAQIAAPAAFAQSIASAGSSIATAATGAESVPTAAEAASQSSIPDVAAPASPDSDASSNVSSKSTAQTDAAPAGTAHEFTASASDAPEVDPASSTESATRVVSAPAPERKWVSITKKNMPTLKGSIKQDSRSPFVAGEEQVIPKGAKIDLVMPADCGVLNSEVSQIGDEVTMRIAANVGNGKKVILPAGWYMRGLVTRVDKQKRQNREGVVQVDFDKIVTPDGEYEVNFDAKYTSKDSAVKTVTKQVVTSSGYMAAGAAAGALISIQFTGITGAIATNGYSVAIGAGIGATIGAIGFLKKKGNIKAFLPGDTMQIVTNGSMTIPGLNPEMLEEMAKVPKLEGLDLTVNSYKFRNNKWDDKKAKLLDVDVSVNNHSKLKFHFFDLYVMSDYGEIYRADLSMINKTKKMVLPNGQDRDVITFLVDSPKRKYSLCFENRGTKKEVHRIPIN